MLILILNLFHEVFEGLRNLDKAAHCQTANRRPTTHKNESVTTTAYGPTKDVIIRSNRYGKLNL